jgi:hypothetical protein
LLTFFDFPADHWDHLRTTNPIESVFATKPSLTKGVPSWAINLAFPTLEELIDACPKNIGSATFVLGSANQGKKWVACYFDFVTNRCAELNESGSTPVEAVARLWLALYANTGADA